MGNKFCLCEINDDNNYKVANCIWVFQNHFTKEPQIYLSLNLRNLIPHQIKAKQHCIKHHVFWPLDIVGASKRWKPIWLMNQLKIDWEKHVING